MSLLGSKTTSDYIDFDRSMNIGTKLINSDSRKLIGLYIVVSINTGLRVSDVLRLKWSDLEGDTFEITEKKTNKHRVIRVNDSIKSVLRKFEIENYDEFIFVSQKGSIYSVQQINRLLKDVFKKENKKHNISSHSLRKSFGRRVYENNHESEKSLVYLSELFNHTSLSITRKYLGIRQEELNDIYMNL
ncbi:MAG: tyrosine-type recombinase/integrase [Crocinitomicaceae bacterium]|nr:tyrosine-type recombinase/integrase [Crocinitomicaceae bacterium]